MNEHLILEYIKVVNEAVPNAVEVFTSGNCGSFARMLLFAFPEGVIFDYAQDHFVFGFGGNLYDITGNVTSKYNDESKLTNIALHLNINEMMADLSPKYYN